MPKSEGMDKRDYPRLSLGSGVFITKGENAYLAETLNISAGGASTTRPGNWREDPDSVYRLYFILEPERIISIKARVVHEQRNQIGFHFEPGFAIQAEELLTQSRLWARS